MKKYPKEFILLLSDWLRGEEQDKSKFEKFKNIIDLEIIKNKNVYRIWDIEAIELNNIIMNGSMKLNQEFIESSFHTEEILKINDKEYFGDFELVEKITRWLSPYLNEIKIITKRKGNQFDPYKPIEYTLNNEKLLKEYSKEEINLIEGRLKNYKYQNEYLSINPSNKINDDEVVSVLLTEDYMKGFWGYDEKDIDKNMNIVEEYKDSEINDYYCFNIDNFLKLAQNVTLLENGRKMFKLSSIEL